MQFRARRTKRGFSISTPGSLLSKPCSRMSKPKCRFFIKRSRHRNWRCDSKRANKPSTTLDHYAGCRPWVSNEAVGGKRSLTNSGAVHSVYGRFRDHCHDEFRCLRTVTGSSTELSAKHRTNKIGEMLWGFLLSSMPGSMG